MCTNFFYLNFFFCKFNIFRVIGHIMMIIFVKKKIPFTNTDKTQKLKEIDTYALSDEKYFK